MSNPLQNTAAQSSEAQCIEHVFGPVISHYSQKDAIDDGVLVDVSRWITQAGIRLPAVMTKAACFDVLGAESVELAPVDVASVVMPALGKAIFDAISRNPNTTELNVSCAGASGATVSFKAALSANDEGKACMVIMLPEES